MARRFVNYLSQINAIRRVSTDLLQANSAHANGRAISSSGFKLEDELRDCATKDKARLRSSCGISCACVGSRVANACSTGLLFILFSFGDIVRSKVMAVDGRPRG